MTRSDAGSRRSEWVRLTCSTCGSSFERRASEVRPTPYCSRDCSRKGTRERSRKSRVGRKVNRSITEYGRRDLIPGESTKVTSEGYVMVWLGRGVGPYGGWDMQHRYVISQQIGRPLFPGETVHHRNCIKTDNRPENLELWVGSQPSGGRVEDILPWAKEMILRYDPTWCANHHPTG